MMKTIILIIIWKNNYPNNNNINEYNNIENIDNNINKNIS